MDMSFFLRNELSYTTQMREKCRYNEKPLAEFEFCRRVSGENEACTVQTAELCTNVSSV